MKAQYGKNNNGDIEVHVLNVLLYHGVAIYLDEIFQRPNKSSDKTNYIDSVFGMRLGIWGVDLYDVLEHLWEKGKLIAYKDVLSCWRIAFMPTAIWNRECEKMPEAKELEIGELPDRATLAGYLREPAITA